MKFTKFKLDESLFDDDMSYDEMDIDTDVDTDDFDMQPPSPGINMGIADTIINLINDEWEAVQGYNNFLELLNNSQYDESTKRVIKDIVAEENKHVGQLQELLKRISPNTSQIAVGEKEAKHQLSSMVSGIQFWSDTNSISNPSAEANAIDDFTTLSDVDDEF